MTDILRSLIYKSRRFYFTERGGRQGRFVYKLQSCRYLLFTAVKFDKFVDFALLFTLVNLQNILFEFGRAKIGPTLGSLVLLQYINVTRVLTHDAQFNPTMNLICLWTSLDDSCCLR